MNTELIIYDVVYGFSSFISFCLGIIVLTRNKNKAENIFFFLINMALTVFSIGYLLGLNTADPHQSRFYLLFTLANIFTVIFSAHTAFAVFKKVHEQRYGLITLYVLGVSLFTFFITDPNRYVLPSEPYQYFPNFYNAGNYYWMFILFFISVVLYYFFVVIEELRSPDALTRKRALYFIFGFGWAYIIGSIAFLPILGIKVDILISMLYGLYAIPLSYGILQYNLIDLRVFAKNSIIYAGLTAFVGICIAIINFFNDYLVTAIPGFPVYLLPFMSGVLAVFVGVLVWNQIRRADTLKYEFINNISHKFRTPLTHIRWMAEELREETEERKRRAYVDQIQYASMRLFELTNIVMDVAHDEVDDHFFRLTPLNVVALLNIIKEGHDDQIKRKKLHVNIEAGEHVPEITADKTRMQFALQILFENALIYTPEGGTIRITVALEDGLLKIAFRDTGIGIDPIEMPYIFSKFYRTQNARHTDTEGMGIGLYIARNIIEKHHGQIQLTSPGVNKGSTFTIELPLKTS